VGIILETKAGPLAGKKVEVPRTQTILIGRAPDRAQFAVPHDSHMSGVHFAVEYGANGCRVIDKKSTNGTFLNGKRIQEATLANGDEIKSGQTVFVVRIVPDDELEPAESKHRAASAASPPLTASAAPSAEPTQKIPEKIIDRPQPSPSSPPAPVPLKSQPAPSPRAAKTAALTIGGWSFSDIPPGWEVQEGLGLQLDTKDAFPSSIGAMEEPLGPGITLQQYVEAQTKMFREYLREPKIYAAVPPKIFGASETVSLEVRYNTKDGHSIYYQRVYARSGSVIGVLTLTTLEKDLPSVRPTYDSVLSGISFSTNNQ